MTVPNPFIYHSPTKLMVGPGSLSKLAEVAGPAGTKALVVTDKVVARTGGLMQKIKDSLEQAKIDSLVFDEVQPNPSVQTVGNGARTARDNEVHLIVALGGGSVLDAAKGIAITATHGNDIWHYIGGDRVPGPVTRIIAIPTTSGTGSETTPFAVFTQKERTNKQGLYSPYIFPAVSILDAMVTKSMPAELTASTGMDALAHAVEAYTGLSGNALSDGLAEKAMSLIAAALPTAVRNGEDLQARQDMALASAIAGMSITHAGVTAAHGFAMSIGGLFDKPHGLTTGILLPYVMDYNAVACPEKFAKIAAIFKQSNPSLFSEIDTASATVLQLMTRIKLPTKLAAIGIKEDDLERILDDCLERGDFRNNPRPVDRRQALAILQKAL